MVMRLTAAPDRRWGKIEMRQLVRVCDVAYRPDEITLHFQREDTHDLPLDPYQQRRKSIRLDHFEGRAFRRARRIADHGSCHPVASLNRLTRRPRDLAAAIRPGGNIFYQQTHQAVHVSGNAGFHETTHHFRMGFRRGRKARTMFADVLFRTAEQLATSSFVASSNLCDFGILVRSEEHTSELQS